MNETDLVALGYKIRTRHLRFYRPIDNRTRVMDVVMPAQPIRIKGKTRIILPQPRGGITQVLIYGPENDLIGRGEAYCSPKDNYDRKLGHEIAFDRAQLEAWKERSHSATFESAGRQR